LVLACCLALSAAAQTRVRVLTYNIHHAEGTDARFDLERIAKVIKSVEPDVVAVQEVDVRTRRASGVDQALELGRLTGMHAVFGRGIEHEGGWYGNALLSKWPVDGFTNHALPGTPNRERRAVIEARINAPLPFTMWATHLDIAESDRVMAAKAIAAMVKERPTDRLMVLAGDLNAVEGSEPMKLLFSDWRSAKLDQPLLTIPVAKPARQIDYVLYRPADRWRVVEVRVLEESVASDHRPLFAVLEATP
jgi:endonuclease/exonuclease/phosphatase family metal-dependent hydrolase